MNFEIKKTIYFTYWYRRKKVSITRLCIQQVHVDHLTKSFMLLHAVLELLIYLDILSLYGQINNIP